MSELVETAPAASAGAHSYLRSIPQPPLVGDELDQNTARAEIIDRLIHWLPDAVSGSSPSTRIWRVWESWRLA